MQIFLFKIFNQPGDCMKKFFLAYSHILVYFDYSIVLGCTFKMAIFFLSEP